MYLISLKSHLKEKKIEPSVCSRFAFPGFDFVRLPNLSVQFSYSQTLMIRQNASLTKRNNATHPTSKKKGEGKKNNNRTRGGKKRWNCRIVCILLTTRMRAVINTEAFNQRELQSLIKAELCSKSAAACCFTITF